MMVDECFEQALRSPHRLAALRSLAMQCLSQGQDKAAVFERFEKVRQALRLAKREQDEDAVMEVMDFLVGWCSPHMQLPPDPTGQPPNPSPATNS